MWWPTPLVLRHSSSSFVYECHVGKQLPDKTESGGEHMHVARRAQAGKILEHKRKMGRQPKFFEEIRLSTSAWSRSKDCMHGKTEPWKMMKKVDHPSIDVPSGVVAEAWWVPAPSIAGGSSSQR